jgi:glycerol-3-phosphate dehydrogenase (NAD(P)+)
MLNIVCIGAGVMSSAFAAAQCAQNKVSIIPAPFDTDIVSEIKFEKYDKRLDISWPNVSFTDTHARDFDLLVVGVSSEGIPWAIQIINTLFKVKKVPILLLTKGLINKDKKLWLISDYVEEQVQSPVISVSGPCIAKLLAKHHKTEVVMSAKDITNHHSLIDAIRLPFYTIHLTEDYIGAAWASALKNVYAILVAKESYNMNIRSARFSQSLEEMVIWVEENGGKASTVYGLSGLGDLYVTCQGGRNGQLGQYIADGLSISVTLEGPMKGVTVEGVDLALTLIELCDYQNKPLFSKMTKLLDTNQ